VSIELKFNYSKERVNEVSNDRVTVSPWPLKRNVKLALWGWTSRQLPS